MECLPTFPREILLSLYFLSDAEVMKYHHFPGNSINDSIISKGFYFFIVVFNIISLISTIRYFVHEQNTIRELSSYNNSRNVFQCARAGLSKAKYFES